MVFVHPASGMLRWDWLRYDFEGTSVQRDRFLWYWSSAGEMFLKFSVEFVSGCTHPQLGSMRSIRRMNDTKVFFLTCENSISFRFILYFIFLLFFFVLCFA